MKKAVIKRRKRVVPALQEQSSSHNLASTSVSPEPNYSKPSNFHHERGSANIDGSINLGIRSRSSENDRHILPEPRPIIKDGQRTAVHPPPVDFTGYTLPAVNQQQQQPPPAQHPPENKLPPLTYSPPSPRLSVSPHPGEASTRKRSFSYTEGESPDRLGVLDQSSKRLSSIKSILNPTQHPTNNPPIEPSLLASSSPQQQQHQQQQQQQQQQHQQQPPSQSQTSFSPTRTTKTAEQERLDRRAELQREADMMRELLAAKERELARLDSS
jgi:hypothetical protein